MSNNIPNTKLREMGLKAYLEASKDFHGGNGYQEFVDMIKQLDDGQLSLSGIATNFKVSRPTIYAWVEDYETNQEGEA